MKDKSNHWTESFYGGERDFYGTVYKAMGTFERMDAERQVEDALALLKPEQGSHILDWCGGFGRHAIPLAKRGFKVTVLDFSEKYLAEAKAEAEKQGVELQYIHADFRNTPADIQADYAINLFTSGLGYLSEEDDIIALRSLFTALKPKAKLLIDTINLFWIAMNFKETNWDESSDGKKWYLQRRKIDYWMNTEHALNV